MRTLIFMSVLLFLAGAAIAQARTISEDQIAELVSEKNLRVQEAKNKWLAAQSRTGYLRRSFTPDVVIEAGSETFTARGAESQVGPYYAIKGSVNLYSGGQDQLEENARRLQVEKRAGEKKVTLSEETEAARQAFWRALFQRELLERFGEYELLLRESAKEAANRIKGGVATQTDKYEFDIKLVSLTQDMRRTEIELEREVRHLKILLGIESDQELQLVGDFEHDHSLKKILDHSEHDHEFRLKPLGSEVSRLKAAAKQLGRSASPKLNAYALWMQNNQRAEFRPSAEERQESAVGLELKIPLGAHLEGQAEKKSLLSEARAAENRLEFERQKLENELHLEIKELQMLDSLVHEAGENIQRSKTYYNLTKSEYRRGVKNSSDMLSATERFIMAKVSKMQIIRDFQLAKAHVLAKLGERHNNQR